MRAIRIHTYGGAEQIQLDEAPVPACGATDLLVHVVAAGVNPVDWKIRGAVLAKLAERVDAGRLRVLLGQEFALADAAHAHRLGESGKARGKMVLHVNSPRV